MSGQSGLTRLVRASLLLRAAGPAAQGCCDTTRTNGVSSITFHYISRRARSISTGGGVERKAASPDLKRPRANDGLQWLRALGLVLPRQVYAHLDEHGSQAQASRLTHAKLLQSWPAAGMSVAVIAPGQMVSFVQAAAPLEVAEAEALAGSSKRQAQRQASAIDRQQKQPQHEQQQQQQQQRKRQERQHREAPASGPVLAFGEVSFITSPGLSPDQLQRASSSSFVINLNSQLRTAMNTNDNEKVLELFESLLARGMAEAASATQQQQQSQSQQQEELGSTAAALDADAADQSTSTAGASATQQQATPKATEGNQQQQQLQLPRQYQPDHFSLGTFARSLTFLGEDAMRSRNRHQNAARWQEPVCSVARAERAAALWGQPGVVKGPGLHVVYALMLAYRLAGHHSKAVELFKQMRQLVPAAQLAALPPQLLFRVYACAVRAAISAEDFETADDIARCFSSRAVTYTSEAYCQVLSPLYRILVRRAGMSRNWEVAVHWLQELINHDSLLPVPPASFIRLLHDAADAGRADMMRLLMQATDDYCASSMEGKPLVYHEQELLPVLLGAGRAGDTDLLDSVWARLLADAGRDALREPMVSSPTSTAAAPPTTSTATNTNNNTAASTSTHEQESGSNSSSSSSSPSAHAFVAAAVGAASAQSWSRLFERIAEAEEQLGVGASAAGGPLSPYTGLRRCQQSLATEAAVAAAFAQLKQRKDAGQPITAGMLTLVCRAVARLGSTEVAGRMFDAYGTWGLSQDADAYNAVIEACEAAGKVAAVESLLSYMSSRGVEPNAHSWNLLASAALRTRDDAAAVRALRRLEVAGGELAARNRTKAIALARELRSAQLAAALRSFGCTVSWVGEGSSRSRPVGGAAAAAGAADVWHPGMQPRRGSNGTGSAPLRYKDRASSARQQVSASNSAAGESDGLRETLRAALDAP